MRVLRRAAIVAAIIGPASVLAADVGVSVSIGEPGFYGRIDIGNVPPPVIFPAPVVIQPVPVGVVRPPIYLHVPPGHEKHWSKHCRKYNACGQPVYFVPDSWYNNVYVPNYHRQGRGGDKDHGGGHGYHGRSHGHGHGHGHK